MKKLDTSVKLLVCMVTMLFSSWAAQAQFPAPYCAAAFANNEEPITSVTFAGIANTSPAATGGAAMEDFTQLSATVTPTNTYPITLKGNTAGTSFINWFRVYIDWNQDADFDDAGEMYDIGSIQGSTGVDAKEVTGNIIVPATAVQGTTRMRVVKRYNQYGTACNTAGYGETEDYSVVVTAPPACVFPSDIVLSGVAGPTSATITWVAPANAPSGGYEYILSTTNTAPGASATGTDVAGTTLTLNSLPSNTAHYLWVRSDCGGTFSQWSAVYTFTTACDIYAAPFLQNFATGVKPVCWTTSSASNVPNTLWKFAGTVDYAPGNTRANGTFAWVDGSDPSDGINDVTLTSPLINLAAVANPELVFEYFSNSANADFPNNIFNVEIFNGTVWTNVYTNDTSNPNWRTIRIPLAAYAGTTIQVRFIVDKTAAPAGNAYYNDILLDNVTIQEIPACLPPVLPVATAGVSDVSVEWEAPAAVPANGYEYELRSSGAAGSGATGLFTSGTVTGGQTSAAITGLAAITNYVFYVRSACGTANNSEWVSVAFGTIPVNDNCDGAIEVVPNADYNCAATVAGSTANATLSMAATPCSGNPDDDVWFYFTATAESHRITIGNVAAVSGTGTDMYFQVLTGGCGEEESLLCSDANTNNLNNLTPGDTYLIRVYSYGNTYRNSFTVCIGTPPPPPANDDCENATALTVNPDFLCGATTTGTTMSATNTMEADPCSGNPDDDVFFTFVATAQSHRIALSNVTAVTGTSTDMYFQVLAGECGGFDSVLCSDDNDKLVTGLTPGETYYVRVYSYSDSSRQNFTICVGTPPAPPANDNCEGAVALTVNADINCTATATGTTLGASNSMEADPCLGNPDDDVFYTFVATHESHRISLSNVTAAIGSATDMYFQVLAGECGNFESLLCSDPNSNTVSGLTPGDTYYVRVYGFGAGTAQNFTICVATLPEPPANDECETAVALTVNTNLDCTVVTAGTTAGATNTMAAAPCGGNPDDDVFYTFVATETSHRISLNNITAVVGTSTDMYFQVLAGECGSFESVLCSDPQANTATGLTPGDTYYIRVYGYGAGTAQNFNICVGTNPPPPANDDCASAIVLTPGGTFDANAVIAGNGGATNSVTASGAPVVNTACGGYGTGGDIWFSAQVPASGTLTLETRGITGSNLADTVLEVYSGTCGALTYILCSDDITTTTNLFSRVALTNRTPGEVIFARVWEYANDASGTVMVSAYDGTLSNGEFDIDSFKAYPNPVKDVLTISHTSEITSVAVFNVLGQQVLAKEINAAEAAIDMSALSEGAYIVNVVAGNYTKTIKIVKKQ